MNDHEGPSFPIVPQVPVSDDELFVLARWKGILVDALLDHVYSLPEPSQTAMRIGMSEDAFRCVRAHWYEGLTIDALVVWCHRADLNVRFPASTRI